MQKIIRAIATLIILTVCLVLSQPSRVSATTVTPTTTQSVPRTVTLWLQATDSCQEGLPGASFSLVDASGQATVAPLTRGTERVTIANAEGNCPLAHGSCALPSVGCTTWHILAPATGSATYTIVENTTEATTHGLTFAENPVGPDGSAALGFRDCTAGSACHGQSGTVTVDSSGSISVTVENVAPDKSVQTYGPFTGTRYDPVLFHNYGVGSDYWSDPCVASAGNVQMNYGTGTQSAHCRYVP